MLLEIAKAVKETLNALKDQNIENFKQANELFVGTREKGLKNYLAKKYPKPVSGNGHKVITRLRL